MPNHAVQKSNIGLQDLVSLKGSKRRQRICLHNLIHVIDCISAWRHYTNRYRIIIKGISQMNQIQKIAGVIAILLTFSVALLNSSTAFAYEITQEITGSWYNPEESGHGVILELLPDNSLLAYWFTYDPDGNQAWFVGSGIIQGNSVSLSLLKTDGGFFGTNFDTATVVSEDWGTLDLTFSSCNAGVADYNTNYGSGTLAIQSLTHVKGLPCVEPVEPNTNAGLQSVETNGYTISLLGCARTGEIKNLTSGDKRVVVCDIQVINHQADRILQSISGIRTLLDNFSSFGSNVNISSGDQQTSGTIELFLPQNQPITISYTYWINIHANLISSFATALRKADFSSLDNDVVFFNINF